MHRWAESDTTLQPLSFAPGLRFGPNKLDDSSITHGSFSVIKNIQLLSKCW